MTILTKDLIISQLESTEEFPIALSEVWEWLGYSRKENALQSFRGLGMAESIDFIQLLMDQCHSIKPITEIKMTVDCFKLWAMSAQTAKGKEVRLYYLQVEKEWKAQNSLIPKISLEQIEAFQFQKNVFSPWVQDHPVAGDVFLSWQGVKTSLALESSQTDSVPNTDSLLRLIDTLSLTANRAGLAGNKSTKEAEFLDKQLDKIRPQILALQADRDRLQSENNHCKDTSKALMAVLLRMKAKDVCLFQILEDLNQQFSKATRPNRNKNELLKTMTIYADLVDHIVVLYKKDS